MARSFILTSPALRGACCALACGAVGMLAILSIFRQADPGPWAVPLHATATASGANFIMATGQIDDAVEGVFFLDRITGMLQCWVLNKNNGTFAAKFGYETVFKDVGVQPDMKADLLLTTGNYLFAGGGAGGSKPANCVIYVLNDTTGQFAVYSIPWNPMLHAKKADAGVGPIVLLNTGMTRDPKLLRP
jgi:hypothetical protein